MCDAASQDAAAELERSRTQASAVLPRRWSPPAACATVARGRAFTTAISDASCLPARAADGAAAVGAAAAGSAAARGTGPAAASERGCRSFGSSAPRPAKARLARTRDGREHPIQRQHVSFDGRLGGSIIAIIERCRAAEGTGSRAGCCCRSGGCQWIRSRPDVLKRFGAVGAGSSRTRRGQARSRLGAAAPPGRRPARGRDLSIVGWTWVPPEQAAGAALATNDSRVLHGGHAMATARCAGRGSLTGGTTSDRKCQPEPLLSFT